MLKIEKLNFYEFKMLNGGLLLQRARWRCVAIAHHGAQDGKRPTILVDWWQCSSASGSAV